MLRERKFKKELNELITLNSDWLRQWVFFLNFSNCPRSNYLIGRAEKKIFVSNWLSALVVFSEVAEISATSENTSDITAILNFTRPHSPLSRAVILTPERVQASSRPFRSRITMATVPVYFIIFFCANRDESTSRMTGIENNLNKS